MHVVLNVLQGRRAAARKRRRLNLVALATGGLLVAILGQGGALAASVGRAAFRSCAVHALHGAAFASATPVGLVVFGGQVAGGGLRGSLICPLGYGKQAVTISAFGVQPHADKAKTLRNRASTHGRELQIAAGAAAAVVLILGPVGFVRRRKRVRQKRLANAQKTAVQHLRAGRPQQALAVLQKHRRWIADDETRKEWAGLEITALEQTRDLARLCAVYEESDDVFVDRESASLAVARVQVQCERFEAFGDLRALWRGRERRPDAWLALEFDALVEQDEEIEAHALIEGRQFQGAADAARLSRLALLRAQENAEDAEALLAQAAQRAPKSPEPRLFHAALQEAQGRYKQALAAYQAAVKCAPRDPFLRDHLAEFYRRRGNFPDAMKLWGEALNPPSMDFLWLKTAFWRRVAIPARFEADSLEPPPGELRPLVDYLRKLDPNVFWDMAAFEAVFPHRTEVLARQETFWLRLLQAIRDDHEVEALSLVNLNAFGPRSWHPPLESALSRVLTYRQRGFIGPPPRGRGGESGAARGEASLIRGAGPTGRVAKVRDRRAVAALAAHQLHLCGRLLRRWLETGRPEAAAVAASAGRCPGLAPRGYCRSLQDRARGEGTALASGHGRRRRGQVYRFELETSPAGSWR